jgi:hypothetical protein
MSRDVAEVLEENQTVMAWLAGRALGSSLLPTKSFLFGELSMRLSGHVAAVEQFIVARLRDGDQRLAHRDALRLYADVSTRLAELLTQTPGSARFEKLLFELTARLAELQQAERRQIVPTLQRCLGETERLALGAEIELELERQAGSGAGALERAQLSPMRQRTLEEAKLVLGA